MRKRELQICNMYEKPLHTEKLTCIENTKV